jgi:hypothetical protein
MVYTFQGLQNKRARARLTRFVGEGKPLVGALLGVRLVLERQRQPRTSFLVGRLLAEIEGPALQSGNSGNCGMAPPGCLVWVSVHAASPWLGLDVAIPWIHLFPLVTCADCEIGVFVRLPTCRLLISSGVQPLDISVHTSIGECRRILR